MKFVLSVVAAAAFAASSAIAAPVVYQGSDSSVSSLAQMTNSTAAAAAFAAAAPSTTLVTFESGLPSSLTISGGNITNDSGCGALCGFNTTSGGAQFLSLYGGSATFSFSAPVNAFGFYVTGLQTDQVPTETLTFTDGSSQVINVATSTGGGGAFIGFTDLSGVSSITYNATNDIVAIDDVRFGSLSAVPENDSLALMAAGAGMLAIFARRRRS
jgi:hypothetical protein